VLGWAVDELCAKFYGRFNLRHIPPPHAAANAITRLYDDHP
jgi:hypothetical protein